MSTGEASHRAGNTPPRPDTATPAPATDEPARFAPRTAPDGTITSERRTRDAATEGADMHRTWDDPHAETMSDYLRRMADGYPTMLGDIDPNLSQNLSRAASMMDVDARTIQRHDAEIDRLRRLHRDAANDLQVAINDLQAEREHSTCLAAVAASEKERADRNFRAIHHATPEMKLENDQLARALDAARDEIDELQRTIGRIAGSRDEMLRDLRLANRTAVERDAEIDRLNDIITRAQETLQP